jgi:tRNA modification GTPase
VLGVFGADPGEQIVVRRRSDESVELHCHGGYAAVAAIERALVDQGARPTAWQDWVVVEHEDPIAAAAQVALAEARTERTAAILLDQYQGALRRAFDEIERELARGNRPTAARRIDELLGRADVGLHLSRPWQVAIGGRPNVGKSSLVNAIVGYDRAIVHPASGTTRDVVTATTAIDGWPVRLADTAGLRHSDDPVECDGIDRARGRLAEADLVVLVFDGSQRWTEADEALEQAWPEAIVVHNKSDLPPGQGARPAGLATSALTGRGIDALTETIAERLVPMAPPAGAAVPFTHEQVERLRG